MAGLLPLIDWPAVCRRNLNDEPRATGPVRVFACADDWQAVAWLLRTDTLDPATGRLRHDASAASVELALLGLRPGTYRVTTWNTAEGRAGEPVAAQARNGALTLSVPSFTADLALAVRPA